MTFLLLFCLSAPFPLLFRSFSAIKSGHVTETEFFVLSHTEKAKIGPGMSGAFEPIQRQAIAQTNGAIVANIPAGRDLFRANAHRQDVLCFCFSTIL